MRALYLLALIPVAGLWGGIFFANRVYPLVLGLPFVIFWVVAWVVLSALIMSVIYALDPANRDDIEPEDENGA